MEFVHYLDFLKYFVVEVFCFVVFLNRLAMLLNLFSLTSFLWPPFHEFSIFSGEVVYGLLPPVIC